MKLLWEDSALLLQHLVLFARYEPGKLKSFVLIMKITSAQFDFMSFSIQTLHLEMLLCFTG